MENKIYDLLEKMHIELTGKIDGISNELQEVKTTVTSISNRVTKIETAIENDIKPKISLCLDEIVSIKEIQQERFDTIESKLEQHDV